MTGKGLLAIGGLCALLAATAGAAEPPAATPEASAPFELDYPAVPLLFEPDEPDEPEAATFSYFHVVGTSILPRTSGAALAYDGIGCAHMTGGDGIATYPVTIPDDSLIKFVRLFYCDTNAGSNVSAHLNVFSPPGGGAQTIVSVASTGSAGCGTELSAELNYVVNNLDALALLVTGSAADRSYCGIRVAYYLPYIFRDGFGTGDAGRWSSYVN